MQRQELESLINDLIEGIIVEEDFDRLQQELSENPEARKIYAQLIQVQNILEEHASGSSMFATSKVVPIDKILLRQRSRQFKIAIMAAAAVVVISLVTMRFFFIDTARPSTLVFQTSPGTEFTLVHGGSDDAPVGMALEKGSRLRLSQGTVELTFSSGVKSIVMAPADLTLHEDDVLYMNQGIAWFHVPKGAEGFRVKTKDLNIVDLGTEFGVCAKLGDHDELHVFKGKVKVTTNRLRRESATLIAGEARRIDPIGRLNTIPVKPAAYLTYLPKSLPYLRWSFDKEDGFQVTGSHPLAADITTKPHAAPGFSQGKRGSALSLNGAGQHLVTDWKGFTGNRPRTVSFWLKIPKNQDYHKNPSILGWGDRTLKNAKWKITLDNKGAHTPYKIRLSWGNSWMTARQPISPDQWQHITITSDGKLSANGMPQAEIYINGEAVTTVPGAQGERDFKAPQTSTITAESVPLIIGSDLYADPNKRNFFKGEIDELTIFDGHMTAEQVKDAFLR